MARPAKPIPDGFHTITPYIAVKGAGDAIAFYGKAFGAEEIGERAKTYFAEMAKKGRR